MITLVRSRISKLAATVAFSICLVGAPAAAQAASYDMLQLYDPGNGTIVASITGQMTFSPVGFVTSGFCVRDLVPTDNSSVRASITYIYDDWNPQAGPSWTTQSQWCPPFSPLLSHRLTDVRITLRRTQYPGSIICTYDKWVTDKYCWNTY